MAEPRSDAEDGTAMIRIARCRYAIDAAHLRALSACAPALPPAIQRAPLKRQIEFLAGRRCAERALRSAGCVQPGLLGIANDRTPLWPAGYTGSISHDDGLAIAVASAATNVAIGVDIQRPIVSADPVQLSVGSEREHRLIAHPQAATALWTLKESLFKSLSARIEGRCGFRDFELVGFDRTRGLAQLKLVRPIGSGLPAASIHAARLIRAGTRFGALALSWAPARPACSPHNRAAIVAAVIGE